MVPETEAQASGLQQERLSASSKALTDHEKAELATGYGLQAS